MTSTIKTAIHAYLNHDWDTTVERNCRALATAIAFLYVAACAANHLLRQAKHLLVGHRLVAHVTAIHEPQDHMPCTGEPQATHATITPAPLQAKTLQRREATTINGLTINRKRSAINAHRTTPKGFA
jgi:hypothetical protein